jgi:glycosyltransferase involved in cell wall biosynthesis
VNHDGERAHTGEAAPTPERSRTPEVPSTVAQLDWPRSTVGGDVESEAALDNRAVSTPATGARRPRVLVITQNGAVPGDRRVWNELMALRESGYEVVAICPVDGGTQTDSFERRDSVDIFRYAQVPAAGSSLSYMREYASAFWRIRRLARKVAGERGFEIVQASNPPDFLLLAVHFLKRRGARFIFDHHDLAPELYLARFGGDGGIYFRLALALEWLNFRVADVVLATNESYRAVAVRRGHRRPEDVFVVRSGPSLERFLPTAPDVSLKRGHAHLISFIGLMEPQDGIDHAIQALALLHELRDDWHADFAGAGSALAGLRQLTEDLGLSDHVEFVGLLQDDDLRRLLCSSDVCLVPDPKTRLSDTSTLVKVAEYMAMSRPIVAFDLAETRVTAGEAAAYVKPNDPRAFAQTISELLDDPQRRARMGRIGRERIEAGLSWEHSRVQLLAAYEAALKRRPPRLARLLRAVTRRAPRG